MPRALATTVAMFAASLLVLGSAVMLIMGSADKPAATPAPAALDGIEPRTGGARAPRIDADVNPATQALQPPPVPAALQTAPELPAARPGRP
ncbi:MAG: hypothetical protein L6R19_21505, partial [Alphaproteobacteria bacterium]|nr:hypothetical protein [Alphaproteobacteria bacterium]